MSYEMNPLSPSGIVCFEMLKSEQVLWPKLRPSFDHPWGYHSQVLHASSYM